MTKTRIDPFAAERASYDRNDPVSLRGRIAGLEAEIVRLRDALRPFAEITPSTLYSDADNEMYGVYVTDRQVELDFERADLVRAREAMDSLASRDPVLIHARAESC